MEPLEIITQPGFVEQYAIPWTLRILVALLIWFIGKWIAGRITSVVKKVMIKTGMDQMLVQFLGNILYTLLLIAVIIAALDHLGLQTTSLLAIFGAAGLAVGLALKDSLSNFSSGVMLILFRPFKVGDFIEAAGTAGVVEEVRIFSTMIRSGDNRQIIIPNGQIYGGTIVNVSAKPTRRIDLVFGIGYGDDIKKAKQIIAEVIAADERILKDPAPGIALGELGDSSVDINVRPWVNTPDYWPVRADLLENVKLAFDANGISIPFPQRDVHLHEVKSA
ncbi:mechanosensitive ion channel family protein [Thioalkalivibrio sulfidiphilus]|uniref:Small-conductance mechanosensitive channel n=1 Tax=Thioalkalivibrio sulfidiphilus (strain HL-EbGR7) TaxID=396588 RepID=B8GRR3_THISH|nr:mechanosensitive ion channel domain-containing protein [Thioalkalivibrio sulfidiphilus]ACL72617.1 MscS Mechanosensitive ion channel [Thioalkalivibrio sulfidiphilus HL-EbGr7]